MKRLRKLVLLIVSPNNALPLAEFLSDGLWIITTHITLRFSIVCKINSSMPVATKVIKPPFNILKLERTCSASSDHLTLLPFYKEQSKVKEIQEFVYILRDFKIQNFSLWNLFHFAFPKFNDIFTKTFETNKTNINGLTY